VDRIEGDFFAVMGFPIVRFIDLLAGHGWRYDFRGLERRVSDVGYETLRGRPRGVGSRPDAAAERRSICTEHPV
jgi:hypothetical protein